MVINGQQKPVSGYSVEQVNFIKWDPDFGIPYNQVPGANLGSTSFAILDENRMAFLCNSTAEIVTTDKTNPNVITKFKVCVAPRDFIFDNDHFYVLSEDQVIVYDIHGNEGAHFSFPKNYIGVERLTRQNNNTYLLLSSGNSLKVESAGRSMIPEESKGGISKQGSYILARLNGNSSFQLTIKMKNGITYNKLLYADKKVAGVFVVGTTENRIVLDVQTFVSENPITVERHIVSVDYNESGINGIVKSIRIPDCYFVLSNKDFLLTENGTIFNMVTSPEGVYVFKLTEENAKKSSGYPLSLLQNKYHFNDHLLKVDQ